MAAREAELLPMSYFHVVFTLPSASGNIAYHNRVVIYGLLFSASAETMLTTPPTPGISAPSSASPRYSRARIKGGTVRPSAFAAFRLTTGSKMVR
jgi:hypothetical protein